MLLDSLGRIEQNARRLKEIFSVLAKYGLADWLSGVRYDWVQDRLLSPAGDRISSLTPEVKIRLALTELGTTFVKLGQVLSTRPDMVSESLAAELSGLQSATPPDPPEVICRTITAELGVPPAELFAEFAAEAAASASVGQVHHARLHGGQLVVVKIQHDGIEGPLLRDVDIIVGLAELLEKNVPDLRNYRPATTARYFARIVRRELDFSCERRNIETFAQNFSDNENVRFPCVYPKFCSKRVLTMELFDGLLGSNYEALIRSGEDLNAFTLHAANMYMDMIFRDGFYHADPHPGNYILLPGGIVGVLDCGMVGRVDDQIRRNLEGIVLAFGDKDATELTELVLRLGSAPPNVNRHSLQSEINEFIYDFSGVPLAEFDFPAALHQLNEILRRNRILLPPEVSLLLKTLAVLQGTAQQLSPEFNLSELIRSYHMQKQFSIVPMLLLQRIRRSYRDWEQLLMELPGDMSDIIRRLRNGSFEMKHEHQRLEETVNQLVRGILTAALFLGSAWLWSSKAPPLVYDVSVVGVLGVALSLFLGVRLMRKIGKNQ